MTTQPLRAAPVAVVRWSPPEISIIVGWLSQRDNEGGLKSLETDIRGSTSAAVRRVMVDTKLDVIKPEATQAKVRDKIAAMVAAYRTLRRKAESIGWGSDANRS